MHNIDNSTLKILTEALGDLSQYHSSGWYWDSIKKRWEQVCKTQIYPCPAYYPNVADRCYCSTPIKRHFLIIDKDQNHHFVGSECAKLFGGHYKVCLGCQNRYRGSYKFCKDCRERGLTSFSDEKLSFGKYKRKKPKSLLGVDDSYIQFLFECTCVSEPSKKDLAHYLLPRTTVGYGKYRHKTFEWIKANDKNYFRWLQGLDKAYAKYL